MSDGDNVELSYSIQSDAVFERQWAPKVTSKSTERQSASLYLPTRWYMPGSDM